MGKFSIPEVSGEEIKDLRTRIRPVGVEDGEFFFYAPCDPWTQSFPWGERDPAPVGTLVEKSRHRTLHAYGYPGFFKPSLAEVLAQIPREELDDVVAFRTIGPETADDMYRHPEEYHEGFHVAETILYKLKEPPRTVWDRLLEDE